MCKIHDICCVWLLKLFKIFLEPFFYIDTGSLFLWVALTYLTILKFCLSRWDVGDLISTLVFLCEGVRKWIVFTVATTRVCYLLLCLALLVFAHTFFSTQPMSFYFRQCVSCLGTHYTVYILHSDNVTNVIIIHNMLPPPTQRTSNHWRNFLHLWTALGERTCVLQSMFCIMMIIPALVKIKNLLKVGLYLYLGTQSVNVVCISVCMRERWMG